MFPIRLPYLDADLLLTPPWSHLPPALRWGLLGALVVVPVVLLAWLYRYELRLVPRVTATALFGLRLVVLLLLLALVCLQPVYAREQRGELPGRVLVAVDCSGSMGVADPQREPAEKLRLAKALRLARGVCPEEWLDGWLRDYEEKKKPQWVKDEESAGDPA